MSKQASPQSDKQEEYEERYRRWHGISIQQVGFVNNLFIGLSSAVVFWQGQYLLGKDVTLRSPSERWFYLISALFFLISLLVGCLTAWNRTVDIRQTTYVNRLRMKGKHQEADKRSDENEKRGNRTWNLLFAQAVAFFLGVLLFVITIVLHLPSL